MAELCIEAGGREEQCEEKEFIMSHGVAGVSKVEEGE